MTEAKEASSKAPMGKSRQPTTAEKYLRIIKQQSGPARDEEGNIIVSNRVGGGDRVLTIQLPDGTLGIKHLKGPDINSKPALIESPADAPVPAIPETKQTPVTDTEQRHRKLSKRRPGVRNIPPGQSHFLNKVPELTVERVAVAQFPEKPAIPAPSMENPEKGLDNTHGHYQSKYSGDRYREAQRDYYREWREFLEAIHALTPSERLVKLRNVKFPWLMEIFEKIGIKDILMNQPMSAEVVEKLQEKFKDIGKVINDPEFQAHHKKRVSEFNFWKYLRDVYK